MSLTGSHSVIHSALSLGQDRLLTCTPWRATEGSQLTFLVTEPPVFRAERISNAGADTDAGVLSAGVLSAPWAPPAQHNAP